MTPRTFEMPCVAKMVFLLSEASVDARSSHLHCRARQVSGGGPPLVWKPALEPLRPQDQGWIQGSVTAHQPHQLCDLEQTAWHQHPPPGWRVALRNAHSHIQQILMFQALHRVLGTQTKTKLSWSLASLHKQVTDKHTLFQVTCFGDGQ